MIDQALQLLDRLNEWWTTSEATTHTSEPAPPCHRLVDHNTPPRQLAGPSWLARDGGGSVLVNGGVSGSPAYYLTQRLGA